MRPRMYMTDKEEPSYPRQCRGHKPVLFQSLRQGDSGWRFPSVVMRWPSRLWQVWHTNTSITMLSHRFKKCCMHPKDLELDHTVLTNILKFYKVVYCLSNTDFSFDHFLLAGCGDRRWSRTREAMSLSHSAEVINKRYTQEYLYSHFYPCLLGLISIRSLPLFFQLFKIFWTSLANSRPTIVSQCYLSAIFPCD